METNNNSQTVEETGRKKISKKFLIGFISILIVGTIFGIYKYNESQKHQETDDAQVSSKISPVIPRVGGYIAEVKVTDNQFVKKGDTLVILEDQDYKIKLAEAQARLISAKTNVGVATAGESVTENNVISTKSNVQTVDAQMESAKVNLWRTQRDYERYKNLIQDHSITQQQFDQVEANYLIAQKQLDVLKAQKQQVTKQTDAIASQAGVNKGQVAVANASIATAQAGVDAAKLNLSYTVVTAATDGFVGTINVQPGQMVQAGQALFQIVPDGKKWIVANFKETQLTNLRVGQVAEIKVDAFPNQKIEGTITSFSPATGAKTSLLPPDNASGNFVKTVQRIPVRIDFDANTPKELISRLSSGMSVIVDVHVK